MGAMNALPLAYSLPAGSFVATSMNAADAGCMEVSFISAAAPTIFSLNSKYFLITAPARRPLSAILSSAAFALSMSDIERSSQTTADRRLTTIAFPGLVVRWLRSLRLVNV
jgi:hypothetical protein